MDVQLKTNDNISFKEDSRNWRRPSEGLGQITALSKQEFGELQIYISSQLNKIHVGKLAVFYGFSTAEKDRIHNYFEPNALFVELLIEKGKISASDLADFLHSLRVNNLEGIADDIQKKKQIILKSRSGDEVKKDILSKNEVAEFGSHHTYKTPAPEEGGTTLISAQKYKRKPDSVEDLEQGKKAKQVKSVAPGKSKIEQRAIYIHILIDNYRELCMEDKATLIGIASEITAQRTLQKPKYLYMIKKGDRMELEEETYFRLKCASFIGKDNDILISPYTTLSIVSPKKFEGVNPCDLTNEVQYLKSSLHKRKDMDIPSCNVRTVKYDLQPKHPVLSMKGVIKDISKRGYEDNSTPRRVITLIDSMDDEFLSVVLHEKDCPISVHTFQKNSIVELRYFETARTQESRSKTNFLTSTRRSVIIKDIKHDAYNNLKDFELVRGRGKSIEGIVTAVEEAVTYDTCLDKRCPLKEVNITRGGYYCSSCKKTYRKAGTAYYMKLTIDCDDLEEYEGIIFTGVITELKEKLHLTPSNTDIYLKTLPKKLLNWEVRATYKEVSVEGLNNIFNTIDLVQQRHSIQAN